MRSRASFAVSRNAESRTRRTESIQARSSVGIARLPHARFESFPNCASRDRWKGKAFSCRDPPIDGNDRETKKRDLLRLVGTTARTARPTRKTKDAILRAIEDLEKDCPTADPARNDLLSGKWSLLYYAAIDERSEAEAGEVEGPFLSFFKPLFGGLFRTRSNSQNIDVQAGRVENIAEFTTLFGIQGELNIQGTIRVVSDVRVDVEFVRFILRVGKLSTAVPLTWVKPTGHVDTTYLDETLRIGRGDKGSIFVNARRR